jgi:uncharacterized HAD superfamily protein
MIETELDIALDVEGVLADSHAATAERSDVLTEEHTPPQNYDMGGQELIDEYMHVSSNVWHNHNHEIPPMEDGLREATRTLSTLHNVDILTARVGQDEGVREWLAGYNIHYDRFISTDHPQADKTEYGDHDVHIDDSPHVARDAAEDGRVVLLVDRPYNRDVTGDRIERVSGVTAASELLSDSDYLSELPLSVRR